MIVIPRENPALKGLNSYYVDVGKLLEHFQGALGSGAIHFKSPSAEGVIFFDKDDALSGVYENKQGQIKGQDALDHLTSSSAEDNFSINIYEIDPERIFFWANLPFAQAIYRDLSTEFTDLEGLIRKMNNEKLTGYITASIDNAKEEGLLFFNNGEIIGGSYSWSEEVISRDQKNIDELVSKTKEEGGIFHVSRIVTNNEAGKEEQATNVYPMLEELLASLERVIRSNRKIKSDFKPLLKKKFLEKSESYDFLDPFAAEFEYVDGKISYYGDAGENHLVQGVLESVKEMAEELGISDQLKRELGSWFDDYQKILSRAGIEL
jgi:hypothetical protein